MKCFRFGWGGEVPVFPIELLSHGVKSCRPEWGGGPSPGASKAQPLGCDTLICSPRRSEGKCSLALRGRACLSRLPTRGCASLTPGYGPAPLRGDSHKFSRAGVIEGGMVMGFCRSRNCSNKHSGHPVENGMPATEFIRPAWWAGLQDYCLLTMTSADEPQGHQPGNRQHHHLHRTGTAQPAAVGQR